MGESSWEERMARRVRERGWSGMRPFDGHAPPRPAEGEWNLVEGEWLPIPPWQDPPEDHGMCTDCYEWRRYPPGQEHFGFNWWTRCGGRCGHEHHEHEVWMAGARHP